MSNHTRIINVNGKSNLVFTTASMQLAEKHIDEFIDLYHQNFGVVLDRDVAREKGFQLVRLVEMVECHTNENEYDQLQH